MAEKDTDESTQQLRQRRPRRGLLPPELIEVVVPSLQVGAFTGISVRPQALVVLCSVSH